MSSNNTYETLNGGTYGKSDFGERLVYTKPKYRDPAWAIFFILHIIGMAVAIASWWPFSDSDTVKIVDFDKSQVANFFLVLFLCILIGGVFAFFWLEMMKRFADCIISTVLIVNLVLWGVAAAAGFIAANTLGYGPAIIGSIMFLLFALYTWAVWSRIPFSSVLLSISSQIGQAHPGIFAVSLGMLVLQVVYCVWWVVVILGYFTTEKEPSGVVYFLLLISLYWVTQVVLNISHTTACGVTASYFFSTDPKSPTMGAFKRSTTTSFGSICLGSLVVAILQAIRSILKSSGKRIPCVICILACIESLIRFFNEFAFAQVAIYGSSFVEAAKATWNLIETKGISAVIADNLTGLAIRAGAFLTLIICAAAGFFISGLFNNLGDSSRIYLCVFGGLMGYVVGSVVLQAIHSNVICLFVCFAEDPNALSKTHADDFNRLVGARPELQQIAQGNYPGNQQQNA